MNGTMRFTAVAAFATVLLLANPGHADDDVMVDLREDGRVLIMKGPRPDREHAGHGRWAEQLELSEEQRDALASGMKEAHAAHREAMAEARASGDREAMTALRREQRERMREVLDDVLTPEQRSQMRAGRERRSERAFERLAEDLELHSSQVEPVREVLSDARTALRERGGQERDAIREEVRERLAGILTPAQLEQFEARRMAERPMHRGKRLRHDH